MKPITTLFMLESLDGKINSGSSNQLDVDRDWSRIDGVKEGLHQYYEIEKTTDLFSLNTGRVMAKIGVNDRIDEPSKIPVTFIIIDNQPHLSRKGINYLSRWVKRLILVTTNKDHPAYTEKEKYSNVDILEYKELDLNKLLEDLGNIYHIKSITIQSGGNLNGLFLRNNLIDYVHIVIAPILVGGRDTNTLIDGDSITTIEELHKLKALELLECNTLEHSYIELKYKVRRII